MFLPLLRGACWEEQVLAHLQMGHKENDRRVELTRALQHGTKTGWGQPRSFKSQTIHRYKMKTSDGCFTPWSCVTKYYTGNSWLHQNIKKINWRSSWFPPFFFFARVCSKGDQTISSHHTSFELKCPHKTWLYSTRQTLSIHFTKCVMPAWGSKTG